MITEPAAPLSRLRQTLQLLALFAVCIGIKLLANPGYFFHDDVQHQYLPVYYDIGRGLRDMHLPLETMATWYGGDYVIEYQYALFNPVALLSYLLIVEFDDLVVAATVVAVLWYLLLCVGSYVFVRSMAGHVPALLGVATVATTQLTANWFASAWLPGLLSLAWFPWLLLGLAGRMRSEGWTAVVTAGSCFGIATSGWPHGLLAMFVIVAVYAARHALDDHSRWDFVRTRLLPCIGGTLIAAAAWWPILVASREAGRPSLISNDDDFLVAPLTAILNAGFPTHREYWYSFAGFERFGAPYFYLSPLLLALPLMLDRQRWRRWIRDPSIGPMLAAILIFVVASLGPSSLGPFRWPFRHLLYAYLLAALLLPIWLSEGLRVTRARLYCCAALALMSALLAWQKTPRLWHEHGSSLVLVGGMIAGVAWLSVQRRQRAAIGAVIFVTVVCALYVHVLFPRNDGIADWAPPKRISEYQRPPGVLDGDRLLFVAEHPTSGLAGGPEFYSGNLHLFAGLEALNGYSPLRPRELERLYCFTVFGTACRGVAHALLSPLPPYAATAAELAGVTRVIVRKAERRVIDALEKSTRFSRCGEGRVTRSFCTQRKSDWPAPVSWADPAVQVRSASLSGGSASVQVANHSADSGSVVLSLPWRPGLEADFSAPGERAALRSVDRSDVGLVVLEIPPLFDGAVHLKRRYPYLRGVLGWTGAGSVALLVAGVWLVSRRRTNRAAARLIAGGSRP